MSTLANKIALVTGGSRGIGAATVQHLAAAGATVAFSYKDRADRAQEVVDKVEAAGGKAQAFQSDAADPTANENLVKAVVAAFGGLDVLVNNAGVFTGGLLAKSDIDVLTANYEVNVRGVYGTTQAAIPHLSAGGRIINIGSVTGVLGTAGFSAYGATKAAVAGLTQSWAKELGHRNITVNAIHPGSVDTEMNPADGEHADAQRATNVFNRYGKPSEIATVVTFLAGPGASFITGACIPVDGGYTA